jgi:CRP/FNR family transcriptional regulator
MSDHGLLNAGSQSASQLFAHPSLDGKELELLPGHALYRPGDLAEHLYYIHTGQVRLYLRGPDGSGRLLEILGPGQWFGCPALAEAATYDAQAVTVVRSVVTQVRAERMLALLGQAPELSVEIIRYLAGGLKAAREDSARLVFDDCNERLIKTLVRFSRSAAATQQEDGVVLHITHEQLAQAIGVARETVSLALTEMRHQNLVRTGRNQLRFNPDALRQFSRRTAAQVEPQVA